SSPASSASKLSSPPLTTQKPPLVHKRKRNDPKPIWAVREHEVIEGQPLHPPPPKPLLQSHQPHQPHASQQAFPARPPPAAFQNNGASAAVTELQRYERPITNDRRVYDEITRKVCDFIWVRIVEDPEMRELLGDPSATQVEIEAKWGQLQTRDGQRLKGYHDTECVLKSAHDQTRFVSTMSLAQHKKLNQFLNSHVMASQQPGAGRIPIAYAHTKEIDMFYELDQAGFDTLSPMTRIMLAKENVKARVRVTRDEKTGAVINAIIKKRVENLEISSPNTEWDYRISINLEIPYHGPLENLAPVTEPGAKEGRRKDRMTYSWLGAYRIDLTQVSTGTTKNHELELEVAADKLLDAARRTKADEPISEFEELVSGMVNNLRVLSRELTPPKP
ncbi:mRNA triphosphatase CET1, partial [Delitschia confertaspora ATCC 74209]